MVIRCRAMLALLVVIGLAGCGFTPVYAPEATALTGGGRIAPVQDQFALVHVDYIPDRNGQVLRNHLIDRLSLGAPREGSAYLLQIGLNERVIDLGIRKDAVATRAQIRYFSHYKLVQRNTGETLVSGQLRSTASYNILDSEFGTFVTADDARDRGLRDLGEQLVTRLALYFRDQPGVVVPPAETAPDLLEDTIDADDLGLEAADATRIEP